MNADTAADLHFMSVQYVKANGYEMNQDDVCRRKIRLADISVIETIGQVTASIRLNGSNQTHQGTFGVLPSLTYDVIFGDELLGEIQAFTKHQLSFRKVDTNVNHPSFNILVNLGYVSRHILTAWRKIRAKNRTNRDGSREEGDDPSEDTAYMELDDYDAAEMARQDRVACRISRSTGQAKIDAERSENRRIADYKAWRLEYRAAPLDIRSQMRPPKP